MTSQERPLREVRLHNKKKAFHHKSRTGCRTCKARRVKCDERRPACKNCDRCDLGPCIYEDPFRIRGPEPSQREPISTRYPGLRTDQMPSNHDPCSDLILFPGANGICTRPLSESKQRRLLELRLLHTYMTYLNNPFHFPKAALASWWSSELPRLALKYENIQCLLFASAAAYRVRHVPHDLEAPNAQRTYTCLALQAQRKAVNELTVENSDAVCFAALLLVVNSFTDLWERPLEPYRPPTHWLYMGRGGAAVIKAARDMQQASRSRGKLGKLLGAQPVLEWTDLIARENRIPYHHLLVPSMEVRDGKTLEAYEVTLSILGSIKKAIDNGEPPHALAKRLVAFPMYTPTTFVKFVDEQRPRALAILAHYFSLFIQAQPSLWWIGNIPQREIRAIQKVLPPEWQNLILEPLAVIERAPT